MQFKKNSTLEDKLLDIQYEIISVAGTGSDLTPFVSVNKLSFYTSTPLYVVKEIIAEKEEELDAISSITSPPISCVGDLLLLKLNIEQALFLVPLLPTKTVQDDFMNEMISEFEDFEKRFVNYVVTEKEKRYATTLNEDVNKHSKEHHNTDGGKTNYYNIKATDGVVDVDDITEQLGMTFFEGNCLKALFGIAIARKTGVDRHSGTTTSRDINKLFAYATKIKNLGDK